MNPACCPKAGPRSSRASSAFCAAVSTTRSCARCTQRGNQEERRQETLSGRQVPSLARNRRPLLLLLAGLQILRFGRVQRQIPDVRTDVDRRFDEKTHARGPRAVAVVVDQNAARHVPDSHIGQLAYSPFESTPQDLPLTDPGSSMEARAAIDESDVRPNPELDQTAPITTSGQLYGIPQNGTTSSPAAEPSPNNTQPSHSAGGGSGVAAQARTPHLQA